MRLCKVLMPTWNSIPKDASPRPSVLLGFCANKPFTNSYLIFHLLDAIFFLKIVRTPCEGPTTRLIPSDITVPSGLKLNLYSSYSGLIFKINLLFIFEHLLCFIILPSVVPLSVMSVLALVVRYDLFIFFALISLLTISDPYCWYLTIYCEFIISTWSVNNFRVDLNIELSYAL